ncbi:lactonase family protein [Sphingomonas sp. Sphisp140]|uniref:lactonase family protein n=1 Tax=unclassified Sphingomonas TaxID=196159 RepID=UPI0039AF6763
MTLDLSRRRFAGAALLTLALPAAAKPAKRAPRVYIGTQGKAIVSARFDSRTGTLSALDTAAQVERPTWVIAHPSKPLLYAVSETGTPGTSQGKVFGFAADATGALRPLAGPDSGGAGPTHLALDAVSGTLFAAHYGSGHVAALPIGANGAPGSASSVQVDTGSGPSPRQKGPHAHGSALHPSGKVLAVADLGADRVFLYGFDRRTRTLAPNSATIEVPAGHGPRHLAFDAAGKFLFLITELVPELRVYRWNAGKPELVETLSTLAAPLEKASGAEIRLSEDGRFVYVSNRVEDSIAGYAIGADGKLREVTRVTADKTPWSFTLAPGGRWLLATNQGAGTVTVHARDPKTGVIVPASHSLAVEKPTSLAFL